LAALVPADLAPPGLLADDRDDALDAPSDDPDPIPDRSVWRSILATWPDDRRLRWGLRANQLEDLDHPWNVAEFMAFQETFDAE